MRESLELARELGDQATIANSLDRFADLAGTRGQPERAARLFGAAESLREAAGTVLSPADRANLQPRVDTVRAELNPDTTNREIASELVISERTADAHVASILRKLGLRSRAQVAAWAAEQGLLGV